MDSLIKMILDNCPHTSVQCVDCTRILTLSKPPKQECDHKYTSIQRSEDDFMTYCIICKEEQ